MNNRLAILMARRTPQAKAFGQLSKHSAVRLGVHASSSVLEHMHLKPDAVDEVVFGSVCGQSDAANVARVIALESGVPQDRVAHTVNRNCASGMESLITAWQILREGRAGLVLAGGTESMSQVPLLVSEKLKGKLMRAARAKSLWARLRAWSAMRPRDWRPVAGIELGLTDPTCGLNMGQTAEVLAMEFGISRDQQDAFALDSHRKAVDASKRCFLSGEIAALATEAGELKLDVGPRKQQSLEQLAKLKPIFRSQRSASANTHPGSVTAGNSCPLTDGATAMLVTGEDRLGAFDRPPLGFVSSYAIAGCDPKRMGLGPVYATAKLLKQTGMQLSDFDLIEINEAFAAQVLACTKAFNSRRFAEEYLGQATALGEIDLNRLNVNGGAIALGHPVGATGARMVMTLLRSLRERGLQRGLATLCVGGGQGVAMLVETN